MGIKERRQREKDQRKTEIIEQARKLFLESDIESPTMQSIADALEISKGSIYLHFKNKEKLLLEILGESIDHFSKSIENAFQAADTGIEKIRALALAYIDFSKTQPEDFYFFSLVDLLETDLWVAIEKKTRGQTLKILKNMRHLLEKALAQGVREGSLRKDLNVEMTALVFIQVGNGFMQRLAKAGPNIPKNTGFNVDELIRCLFINLIRGILAPERMEEFESLF